MISASRDAYTPWYFPVITQYRGGHIWIVDGIEDVTYNYENEYVWEIICRERSEYDRFMEIGFAPSWGIYQGKVERDTVQQYREYLIMNRGSNGSSDDRRYYTFTDPWVSGQYTYQYNKRIYYNIRPISE